MVRGIDERCSRIKPKGHRIISGNMVCVCPDRTLKGAVKFFITILEKGIYDEKQNFNFAANGNNDFII